MSELLPQNSIQPACSEQARDIIQDLHAILRKHRAELFYRNEQRAMLLMCGEQSGADRYRVVALVNSIAAVGVGADIGYFGKSEPNVIRPEAYAQAEDILGDMRAYLTKCRADLLFEPEIKGMRLTIGFNDEAAIVRNITRYGAEIVRANFETVRIPLSADQFDLPSPLQLQRWLRGEKI